MKNKFEKNKQTLILFAICLVIPILGFLSNEDFVQEERYKSIYLVPFTAGLIFLLWFTFKRISNINNKTKYLWILLTYIIFIGLFALLAFVLGFEFSIHKLGRGSFAIILVFLIQYAMKAQQDIATLRLEKEQYKTEEYKSQLKLLQAKIDPHFLFNSLNTLQSMVSYGHKNSVSFIINLSNFYRQIMSHIQNPTISLTEELKILNAYLFLMKSRYEDAVKIDLDIDKNILMKSIPSMALQILLENCFKHNSMTTESPLQIIISNTSDQYIAVKNNLQTKVTPSESDGYGLESLRKRYRLLNIDNGVIVERTNDFFEIKVKIVQSMNVLIVEDEFHTANLLNDIIEEDTEFIVIKKLQSVVEAVSYLSQYQQNIDLLFFDIQLTDGKSFEIFKHIDIITPVIFCTAYDAYTLEAIKSNGIEYILKPFEREEIHKALSKFKNMVKKIRSTLPTPFQFQEDNPKQYQLNFLSQFREKSVVVPVGDIAMFYIDNEVLYLLTFVEKKLPIFKKLEYIKSVCNPQQFFRVNRSMLVNRKAIISFEPYFNRKIVLQLSVNSSPQAIVSRLKVTDFQKWLEG